MIKLFVLITCPLCDYIVEQIKNNDNFVYIDIGTHVKYMHEFMDLRDNRKEFDHAKEVGDIGIPAFVLEDGTITLDPADVGLIEYQGESSSCSIEDHRNGKKGC